MRTTITGCTALDYTLEMPSFAVHLSAQYRTIPTVLGTPDRTLTIPGQLVLCLLLLPHLALLQPCRTRETALTPLHCDPGLKAHGRHTITSTQGR